ncbi:anthranilate O-methyltransferase 1-like [Zingiber officinale]|uniref:Uncharacterized protein n=1 Tax=Zingiber officinale TaxID=94328 RepID=A0A8J5BZZ7_ZINOF|nr:anthranilate O-methyltransferase 1-like [Zingiber officinale]KAG6466359.1 hypothetical protein ZIOFF_075850 [Zingiber officinale]
MAMEQVLHMAGGSGETSYAANSKFQEKSLRMIMPMMDLAIEEVCKSLPTERSMVVVDLGCSTGSNTFLVVSEVLKVVGNAVAVRNTTNDPLPLEIQFYLNDLPGNDFNQVFRSLDQFKQQVKEQMISSLVPYYYIAGLPGTFHGRLLPHQSVHFFNSSMSVQFLSQMPQGIEGMNKKNIYIAKSSPPQVLKVYQEQFQRDFSCFLECRHAELDGRAGRMLLSLPGRKNHGQPYQGFAFLFQLLAQALYDLVLEGKIAEEKLDNFNMPFYCPSMEEMAKMIESQGLFVVERAETFEMNWDPADESSDDDQLDFDDAARSGKNIAKYVRAGFAGLLARQFGEEVIDEAFSRYAANISKHLLREKTKHFILFILLKKRGV